MLLVETAPAAAEPEAVDGALEATTAEFWVLVVLETAINSLLLENQFSSKPCKIYASNYWHIQY
ncbi:hypothetical protein [Polynucleobacter sp. MWH-UH2A]|uniref:hypothetical protein n=1 Tax=Polynucleobacter sp. MWH-UH2A TaxID=1855617 RepID=UPI001BFD70A5|nr:hypothetical protein [Polynucleobacter sp. MWH-UH2A]QWD64618.1 hypothetical protein IC571_03015 [Polynucleobacter sp. MWH-UH2A]